MQVDGKRLVELPRKTILMHYVDLTPEDRELYDKVEENGKEVVERFMENGTVLQNYATVLQIILRLRQICNHSGLCPAYTEMFAAELNQKGKTIISSPECLSNVLLYSLDYCFCPSPIVCYASNWLYWFVLLNCFQKSIVNGGV